MRLQPNRTSRFSAFFRRPGTSSGVRGRRRRSRARREPPLRRRSSRRNAGYAPQSESGQLRARLRANVVRPLESDQRKRFGSGGLHRRVFRDLSGRFDLFDRVLDDCARRGFVQTLLGRRRALSGVRGARGRKTLNFPERAAINAVVQGTAADLMKLAMLAVWRRLKKEGWIASRWSETFVDAPGFTKFTQTSGTAPIAGTVRTASTAAVGTPERARLLLQIHDELLFETRRADADALAKIVVEEMRLGDPLTVPLQIDAEIGAN
ncbi:MAG: hypothetical protein IJO40_05660, partial [Thermoguttaceae bacterium]|nr:hypothetical protein [Thermoguttaceae bacterium]